MQTAPSLDAVDETAALDSMATAPFSAAGMADEAYPLPAELLRGRHGFMVRPLLTATRAGGGHHGRHCGPLPCTHAHSAARHRMLPVPRRAAVSQHVIPA